MYKLRFKDLANLLDSGNNRNLSFSIDKRTKLKHYTDFILFKDSLDRRNRKFFIFADKFKPIPKDVLSSSDILKAYVVNKNEFLEVEFAMKIFNSLLKASVNIKVSFNLNYKLFVPKDIMEKQQPYFRSYLGKVKRWKI